MVLKKIKIMWVLGTLIMLCLLVETIETPEENLKISSTISPKEDYVVYDFMENPSDSLAKALQELKCDE